MPVPGIHQVSVNFIGTDRHGILLANFSHPEQFIGCEYPSDRIMRIAQQEQAAVVGNGSLEVFPVHPVGAVGILNQVDLYLPQTGVSGYLENGI